jgi:thioredoxin reductase (NADPH)
VDSAVEEALFLTRFATKVTMVHRRDSLRASKIMQDRAFDHPKIDFLWDSVVEEVLGDGQVAGAKVRNVKTDQTSDVAASGVFVAIGHTPNTSLFEGQLELSNGYIVVQEPSTSTSAEGVFAAGDVVDFVYRQAITAAGMGSKAAIDAERFLEALGH